MKWTERKVGYAVMHQLMDKAAVVVPNCNYTGYEADLLVVTTDLRLVDVEIKVDRSDLKADLKKDKWWRAEYVKNEDGTKEGPFPPKIWKHYYVMPEKVWDDSLYAAIPPTSGVVVIKEYPHTKTKLLMRVLRRATPNRKSGKITPEQAFSIGRLCNLRMWDRIMSVEDKPKKLGLVKISTEYLRRVKAGEAPEDALLKMMSGTMTMDVTHDFMRDESTFLVWCKEFDDVHPSALLPTYSIQVVDGKPKWVKENA